MNARHAFPVALAAVLWPLVSAQVPLTGLDSGPLGQGESYSFVFERSGSFPYVCRPHPYMKAVVVVEEGGQAGAVNATIEGYAFHPRELRVAPGANVTWTNRDDVVHTASAQEDTVPGEFAWWMVLVPFGVLVAAASLLSLRRKPKR